MTACGNHYRPGQRCYLRFWKISRRPGIERQLFSMRYRIASGGSTSQRLRSEDSVRGGMQNGGFIGFINPCTGMAIPDKGGALMFLIDTVALSELRKRERGRRPRSRSSAYPEVIALVTELQHPVALTVH
jgi:hypothetical protein